MTHPRSQGRKLMAECTPGPWQAEQITMHSAPNERPWVGRLAEGRFAALSCGDTQEEAIANARLIAAAPDLLAALQAIFARMDRPYGAPGHCHTVKGVWDLDNVSEKAGRTCEWCAQWDAARSAIASACGEVEHG